MYKILVINTGSTSTKISLFEGDREIYKREISHDAGELSKFESLAQQEPYRKAAIMQALNEANVSLEGLSAIAARGGTFGNVHGGAYLVEEKLLEACRHPITNHASNLSAIVSYHIAEKYGCKAYIYDAVCTNEVLPIARITGLSDIKRRPFSHTLNTRAVAIKQAEVMGKDYKAATFVIAHLGGGISINIHKDGKIIDLVSDDEGPMSPERAGKLNGKSYVDMCFSGKYNKKSMMKRIKGQGGLVDHLGTNDMRIIEKMIDEGDKHAEFIISAMAYQISKDIAALSSIVSGNVDSIILTGGCAHSVRLTSQIIEKTDWIAPVKLYPGTMEMEALMKGISRVLDGEEGARIID